MKSGFIRSTLVVFQFVVSVFLIIGTISIYRQLHFIQTKKLGFEKEQVIIVHDAYALRPNNVIPFKNEVSKLSSSKMEQLQVTYRWKVIGRGEVTVHAGATDKKRPQRTWWLSNNGA